MSQILRISTANTDRIPGDFIFNDPRAAVTVDTPQLDFAKYDVLILRANHIPAGLQHVRFNLLGKYVKFTSPLYNLPS